MCPKFTVVNQNNIICNYMLFLLNSWLINLQSASWAHGTDESLSVFKWVQVIRRAKGSFRWIGISGSNRILKQIKKKWSRLHIMFHTLATRQCNKRKLNSMHAKNEPGNVYNTYLRSSSSGKKDLETSSANRHSPSVHVASKSQIFSNSINSGSLSFSWYCTTNMNHA